MGNGEPTPAGKENLGRTFFEGWVRNGSYLFLPGGVLKDAPRWIIGWRMWKGTVKGMLYRLGVGSWD